MDVQLIIVGAIVVGALAYMIHRMKKARQGQCSCGCGGCNKGCRPKGV
ncbi:FeoB-associated Cys-rich membrane protein [uncultured Bilophila sp.]|nr:FeoB-associated Cys-rich membrane protein [uncultured Bilophila sp.]